MNVRAPMDPGKHTAGADKLRRLDYLTFKGNLAESRYGWLRLTPAYSVHLVTELLDGAALDDDAVVLDPFGGTGTTALVAKALGRHGISVDMSADYCRLAEWRCNDRNQLAKVLGVAKADPIAPDEQPLFDLNGDDAA